MSSQPSTMSNPSQQPRSIPDDPVPRVTSLVYRREPRESLPDAQERPTPTEPHQAVTKAFEEANGVKHGSCWVTGMHRYDEAHLLPHAEGSHARLFLWLQLMGIVPSDGKKRNEWKVSPLNLINLTHSLHTDLTDGENRRALLRPTRNDLHQLVKVLESGLAQEEVDLQAAGGLQEGQIWRPDWRGMLDQRWTRKNVISGAVWNSHEYQVDFFDTTGEIYDRKSCPVSPFIRIVEELPGQRTYPNSLSHDFGVFVAPLCILVVTAHAVSETYYITRWAKDRWKSSFLQDLEVMSYIVEIMGSDHPSYFRRCSRPSWLGFERPAAVIEGQSSAEGARTGGEDRQDPSGERSIDPTIDSLSASQITMDKWTGMELGADAVERLQEEEGGADDDDDEWEWEEKEEEEEEEDLPAVGTEKWDAEGEALNERKTVLYDELAREVGVQKALTPRVLRDLIIPRPHHIADALDEVSRREDRRQRQLERLQDDERD